MSTIIIVVQPHRSSWTTLIDFFAHWLKSLTIAEFAQSGECPAKWRWKPGEDFLPQLSELSFQAVVQSGVRVLVGESPEKKRWIPGKVSPLWLDDHSFWANIQPGAKITVGEYSVKKWWTFDEITVNTRRIPVDSPGERFFGNVLGREWSEKDRWKSGDVWSGRRKPGENPENTRWSDGENPVNIKQPIFGVVFFAHMW